MNIDEDKLRIVDLKAELDARRPLAPKVLPQIQKHFDVELTYTSNAIEGNTLTLRETAEVIEHGITVGGKRLSEHLEAQDHYDAIQWIREHVDAGRAIGENTITELHRRVVLRSQPEIAGIYSRNPRRIAGSNVVFPNPAKIPTLMESLGSDLSTAGPEPSAAFDGHYRLTAIHPFADGNGRTARLLMNLMLLRAGYPPVAVRPADRKEYLDRLEHASNTGDLGPFQELLHHRLVETLDQYVALFREADVGIDPEMARAFAHRGGMGR